MLLLCLCCGGCIHYGRPPAWARGTIDSPDRITAWLLDSSPHQQDQTDCLHGYRRLAGPLILNAAEVERFRGLLDTVGNKFYLNSYFFPDLMLRYETGGQAVDVLVAVRPGHIEAVAFGRPNDGLLGMHEARAARFRPSQEVWLLELLERLATQAERQ